MKRRSRLSQSHVTAFVDYCDSYFKNLLVIHDDKDLKFGQIKLDKDRSSAGQKGVQNIIDLLGTKTFTRLRCGVGQKDQTLPTEAFILQPFSKEEEQQLSALIETAVKKTKENL